MHLLHLPLPTGMLKRAIRCSSSIYVLLWGTAMAGIWQPVAAQKAQPFAGKQHVQRGEVHLRWQPLGLIDLFDMNLTGGVAYSYAPNKSITFDAGYVFASLYGENGFADQINPASGVILRTGHRWYMGARHANMLEAEAGLKRVAYKSSEQWVGRNVVAGVPAYEELMRINSQKEAYTLHVKYGRRFNVSSNRSLSMEVLAGVGIRYRNYYPELPGDMLNDIENPFASNMWSYGSGWVPDFPWVVRLSYRL